MTPAILDLNKASASLQHLYRHFNKEGELLYVGISSSALRRLAEHEEASHWFTQISSVTIEHYPDRKAAMEAEKAAIRAENPRHNVQRHVIHISKRAMEKELNRTLADESRTNLLKRTVNFKLVYSVPEAAAALNIGITAVKRLITGKSIGTIEMGGRLLITGWALIDYLDHVQATQGVKNDRRVA